MNKEELAVELRNKGYNCAQAVICAYCDDFGISREQAFAISEAFGSGLGCSQGNCGALVGACMLLGLKTSSRNLEKPGSKGTTYVKERPLVQEFTEQVGALKCRDIKGIETGKILCECEMCVRIASRLVDKYLLDK